jgi:hypothetical protein
MKKKRVLFLLKERFYNSSKLSYGLINSATHIARFLERKGYDCKIETVIDSNFIDKEVFEFKPDFVIIEALWVSAEKLKELIEIERYKHINWIVRVHSDVGFLSSETMAIKYINDYIDLKKKNLSIALNNKEFDEYLSIDLHYKLDYLPNIICKNIKSFSPDCERKDHIDIACFGALRLLKNQCFQAICAIAAADKMGKTLHFHITKDAKSDQVINPVLNNLEQIFKKTHHKLIIHDWLDNMDFQKLIQKMDIGMQLSFTESFNIVTADFINNNRLILVSDCIKWMPDFLKTSTTDYNKVINDIIFTYENKNNILFKYISRRHLSKFNMAAKKEWLHFLDNHH